MAKNINNEINIYLFDKNIITRVVTKCVVGGVVVVVIVLERLGSHILNTQKFGSNI
jgi:hypothetical protein